MNTFPSNGDGSHGERLASPSGESHEDSAQSEAALENTESAQDAPAETGESPGEPVSDDDGSTDAHGDRLAQPVNAEEPPRLTFPVVGIGASAGGLEACIEFFKVMPSDAGVAFVLILHLAPDRASMVPDILQRQTPMVVREIEDGMEVEPDHVYVIRPGHVVTLNQGRLHLGERLHEPRHNHPVDDYFRSLAEEQRERAVCIIMSGMGSNGTGGAQSLKAVGGVAIAQAPESAKFPSMPQHLIDAGHADFILRPNEMPRALLRYVRHTYTSGRRTSDAPTERERPFFGELLTILHARTRQDFSGYKTPTIWRRVQRRMSLGHTASLAEYTTLLRQSTSEVAALADDLMIHVTGFFRDAPAWESLRTNVIAPLVASREAETSIRCWVTACSTGEEAYTLAMLIHETAEAAGKRFDVKVFATDMAERTLTFGRNGVYPIGIEAEVDGLRLERYFVKEASVYRVKKELREMVVFAPQNVLQDPPFSRLDVCTCRNLLIYLEPDVQKKVLSLLHFGLREGGALMLGTSETVGAMEEIFEVIDKRSRIYRRIGRARPPSVDFPLATLAGSTERPFTRPVPRASVTQITTKALLERCTPPAVTLDRLHRIVYFHGDLSAFLQHPAGEPTRDLLMLAKESLRSTIRVALHTAESAPETTASYETALKVDGERRLLTVTVAPLEVKLAPGFLLVTFETRAEPPPAAEAAPSDDASELRTELARLRGELNSTIEELQSSNEEMKASSEETMSINEELQSSNKELETSKEELQSLNEELTTVNAQLQNKMEEHENTSNDLSSLLSSTDIAVIFLDTTFRIRRYTPAIRELIELLPPDVGRPLSDMARKFDDPDLLPECQAVLEKLIPREREIVSESGRIFMRRILPYRTVDHRINGVVITFVEVTELKQIERVLKESEDRYRQVVAGAPDFAMMLLDTDGVIRTWSVGAELVLGYTEAEVIGQPASMLFPLQDRLQRLAEATARAAATGRSADAAWLVRKDGAWIWGAGVLSAVRDEVGRLTGYVHVFRDETNRKRIETERSELLERAQVARREAESAAQLKDRFLSTLSHELRTPLSAIMIWTKLLRENLVGGADRDEGFAIVERSAEAQRRLIEDLLDTSRIAAGTLRLEMIETALLNIVRAEVDTIAPMAAAKGLNLDVQLQSDVGLIVADPDRVAQIMANLLGNAIKFTPPGGWVRVHMQRQNAWVEIVVSDEGIGIAPTFLPDIFTPFSQAEAGATRTSSGLGLGLAITKQLVELHGGTIRVESRGLGQGAAFLVRFPAHRSPDSEESTRSNQQAVAPHTRESLAGACVLVVEDEPPIRDAVALLLRTCGAQVLEAGAADEAFSLVQQHDLDAVVADIGLPGEDGYSFIRRVRAFEADQQRRPLPAVALTAFGRAEEREAALAAGFNHHATKPVDLDRFIELLAELTAKKRQA